MAEQVQKLDIKDRKIVKTKRKGKDAKGMFDDKLQRKDSSDEGDLEFEDSDVEQLSDEEVVQRDEKDSDEDDWSDCDDDKEAKDKSAKEMVPSMKE